MIANSKLYWCPNLALSGCALLASSLAHLFSQLIIQCRPHTRDPPLSKVAVNHTPRWQVMGHQSPLATTSQHIQNAVQDLPPVVLLWSSTFFHLQQQRRQYRLFCFCQVSLISLALTHLGQAYLLLIQALKAQLPSN